MKIGIDLGGTKTEIACLDTDGTIVLRRRVPTPRDDYDGTVATIARLVRDAEHELGRAGTVGVGIPGSPSPATGRIRNANSTWLNGRTLTHDLEAALRRPVRVQNDANCLAVSEAVDGAAAGARVVFAVILGTGVGAGIAIDGAAWVGRNAIAGEWGHNALPSPRADEQPGPPCWCGRRGCVEAWLSGPALAAGHRVRTGRALDAAGIARAAAAGDAEAVATLDRHAERLGRALAVVVNVLDPDAIVLGGGLSNIDALRAGLARRIAPHVFADRFDTPVLASRHGDSSGVRGAARLW